VRPAALPDDWDVFDGGAAGPEVASSASSSDITGRVPAHDLDAEAAVLSALMVDEHGVRQLPGIAMLRPEHFYSESHRRVYEAICDLAEKGDPIDIVTVGSLLKARERLAQVGGMAYLTELLNAAPAVANVGAYAKIVYDRWRVRALGDLGARLHASAYLGVDDAQEFADEYARDVGAIAQAAWARSRETNAQACKRIFTAIRDAQVARASGNQPTGLTTGIKGLDALTSGLHAGKKLTIVAKAKVGKTTIGIQVAVHVAKLGFGVDYFITEQTKDEAWAIAMAHLARVNSQRVELAMAGKYGLAPDEWGRLMAPAAWMSSSPLEFEHRADGWSADTIESAIVEGIERRRRTKSPPLAAIVVDYVQEMKATAGFERKDEHQQIGENARRLKVMAEKYKIAVVELAQQDPGNPKDAPGRKPSQYEVSGCKKIVKHTNTLAFLIRNARYNATGKVVGEDKRRLTLYVPTNRGGQSAGDGDAGDIQLEFEPEFGTFTTIEGSALDHMPEAGRWG